jgi:hypothetical protein
MQSPTKKTKYFTKKEKKSFREKELSPKFRLMLF